LQWTLATRCFLPGGGSIEKGMMGVARACSEEVSGDDEVVKERF